MIDATVCGPTITDRLEPTRGRLETIPPRSMMDRRDRIGAATRFEDDLGQQRSGRVNAYLGHLYPQDGPHAVLASLDRNSGTGAAAADNKVLVSIVNVEREGAVGAMPSTRPDQAGHARVPPPLSFNIILLLAAHFEADYVESLKFLSSTIAFFQTTPTLSPRSSADFPDDLERLTFEFVSLSLQEMNNLWGVRGSTYRPSIVIRMRMLTFDDGRVEARVPAVTGIRTTAGA